MKYLAIIFLSMLLNYSVVFAVSPAGEQYIEKLSSGGPASIRDAAKGIYHTRETDTYVLDVLAEVLLRNSPGGRGNIMIDALSWGCKALGQSGNSRYRTTLQQVDASTSSRKLKKYARQAIDSLGGGSEEQYLAGSVNLEEARDASAARAEMQREEAVDNAYSRGMEPITVVKVGMSMQEVVDLIGPPNATTQYQTGKAYIPFNFKGGDLVRTVHLFRGQGRVVYSNSSHYDTTLRVIEVQINPDESGYP